MLNDNFGDELATFLLESLFLTKTRFYVSKCNIKEQSLGTSRWRSLDLCEYCLNPSEEMLFRFIYCPQRRGYFSSIPSF